MNRLVVLFLLIAGNTFGQDYPEWSISNINSSLKTHADVVVRKYDLAYTVINKHKAIRSISFVKTILNSHGSDEAFLMIPYDDFRKIKKFDAVIIDNLGNKIEKIKNSDIIDYNSGGNSVDDTREKVIDLSRSKYPYTISVDYEVEFNTNFYSPMFAPQPSDRVSVEKASFTLSFPESDPVRYKAFNVGNPEKIDGSYVWSLNNLKAIEEKEYYPDFYHFIPIVLTSPNAFELDNSSGSLKSWKEFGSWYLNLNKGRDVLSQEDVSEILKLTAGISDDREKIKAIYHYMQSKTRYVSVQLGIGGYQSMTAEKVSDVGWGDCKGLTNYTEAMLKAIGINSYPALVNSGFGAIDVIEEFPSNQFDHVILCVPIKNDTIWLECTSREMPFNFLGDFTSDRKVLLIKPNGGELINSPTYDQTVNRQSQRIGVWFDKSGQGKAKVSTTYYGLEFDDVIGELDESEDELKKIGYKQIDIPNFTIDAISFEYEKDQVRATRQIELTLRDYATKSGNRIFLKPNLMNRISNYPKEEENREMDVVVRYAYTDVDTIQYHLPEGYRFEYMPKDLHYESQFGTYDALFRADENGLLYIRKEVQFKGTFPKESFNDLVDYIKKLKKADNTKIVLTSST